MWNELKALCTKDSNFILNRWDNPLHGDIPTETQGKLWPSSDEFYHPLNPVFSFFFQSPAQLDLFRVLLLRDGAQGLLDFFMRFPFPKSIKAKIIVPAELSFLVPDGWRPQVLCYRLETTRAMTEEKNYLFYGLISEASLSWPRFKNHIHDWLKQFDPRAPVTAYFATRNELFDRAWIDRKIAFEITAAFQSHFKEQINFVNWNGMVGLATRSNMTFVGLDQWRNGVDLCGVDSMMMAKAPQIWGRGTYPGFRGKKIGSWPVSFQHSIGIYTAECADSDFSHFFFMKKTAPPSAGPFLPYPIRPDLMELLGQRLSVKGFKDQAAAGAR